MVSERLQESGGGVGVLEKPPDTFTELEESEESTLGTIKSSLTVIRNPSLDGSLGILMAKTTLLHDEYDAKSFFNAYVIEAYGNLKEPIVLQVDIAKSEQQSGNPPLYVVQYYDVVLSHKVGQYLVASQVPHEICKITDNEFEEYKAALRSARQPTVETDEEFRRFEATLTSRHQSIVELTDLVNNMMRLIGERLAGKGFAFEHGELVVPPNYASTKLRPSY